jgi:hypothetical protein
MYGDLGVPESRNEMLQVQNEEKEAEELSRQEAGAHISNRSIVPVNNTTN